MKKVSLTENQYKLLKEFFGKKKENTLKDLASKMTKMAIEYDFNSDFGLEAHTEGDKLIISIDSDLSRPFRNALSSVSIMNLDDREDFINGITNSLVICTSEQAIAEGKYILIDFKEVLNLIKEVMNDI